MNDLILLYVEDDAETLEDTKFLLDEFFSKIYTAQDGKKALEMYFELKPDIVILDINLPLLNGLDVATQIREDNEIIPILFLSAYSEKEKLLKAIDLGVSAYIIKPYKINELKSAILKVTQKSLSILKEEERFVWNPQSRVLFFNNKKIKLTKNEILLVKLLSEDKAKLFSLEEISSELFPNSRDEPTHNNVVQLISRFKNKLQHEIGKENILIENIYGSGYRINL